MYDVDCIDLPITTELYFEDHPDHPDIQNRGDAVQIQFNEAEQC